MFLFQHTLSVLSKLRKEIEVLLELEQKSLDDTKNIITNLRVNVVSVQAMKKVAKSFRSRVWISSNTHLRLDHLILLHQSQVSNLSPSHLRLDRLIHLYSVN